MNKHAVNDQSSVDCSVDSKLYFYIAPKEITLYRYLYLSILKEWKTLYKQFYKN